MQLPNGTEIAPCCKFKLAVNRGLPCLKSHDFSGELLPRRCTITVLPFPPVGILLVFAFAFAVAQKLNYPTMVF